MVTEGQLRIERKGKVVKFVDRQGNRAWYAQITCVMAKGSSIMLIDVIMSQEVNINLMKEKEQFEENVKQWVAAINEVVAKLREEISEIALIQEEDMFTISMQYMVVKDLRRRVKQLEKQIFLNNRKEVKNYGRDIS